jgi:hypothetical protein
LVTVAIAIAIIWKLIVQLADVIGNQPKSCDGKSQMCCCSIAGFLEQPTTISNVCIMLVVVLITASLQLAC